MLAAVLGLSCAGVLHGARPIPPEQAGTGAWERLTQLRSFGFDLSFHTDVPLPIEVRFSGSRERSDREAWSGYTRRRSESERVELRAEGPDQYEKGKSGWRRTMRGIETRVLEQGEGVFRDSRLEFAGAEEGRYRYSFRPELPILDPTRTKRLTGIYEVDSYSGLPVRLYCSDSGKTAEWELKLGRFNRAGGVDIPFEPAMTVEARPAGRLSRAGLARAASTVERRLARLGWEHRLSRTSHGLTLLLGQSKSHRQLIWLFSRGNVEVWQGHWAGPNESLSAVEVGNDASRRVVLDKLLGANERVGAEVSATTPVSPVLVTTVTREEAAKPALLVLDQAVLTAAGAAGNGRLEFQDIGSEDDVRLVAALAAAGPLPVDFTTTVKP